MYGHEKNNSNTSNIADGIPTTASSASAQQTTGSFTPNKNPEGGKRKKTKTRNSSSNPSVPLNSSNYTKEHLDAWLETCLNDATTPQLSSSSEFLDYNPTSFVTNRQSQQHQQSQQQQSQINQPMMSHPQQQLFVKSKGYQQQPAPFPQFQPFQRSVPNIGKIPFQNKFPLHPHMNLMHNDGSTEFASLPPIVNLIGSENDNNSTDVLDGSSNPNNSRGFRFSDPCLINPSDGESKVSGQNTPDRRNFNNSTEVDGNNKFFVALMEQINLLHETNSKICRNLHETKVDIEALKHAPSWNLRHRRDSISGLSTHSQPLGFAFGTQSPAPTYHSGMYTPGMMTDVVREVKEAARVREEALLNRVKSMVEERSWSMGEGNLRMMRDLEELKTQVQHLRTDRKEANKRIAHLEAENKYMKQILGTILNNRTTEIIHENEILRSTPIRKQFIQSEMSSAMRQKQQQAQHHNLSLNYGTINHEDGLNTLHITERLDGSVKSDTPHNTPIESKSFSNNTESPLGKNGSFFFVAQPAEENAGQLEREAQQVRRELEDAQVARRQAENRIIALESMVKKLQVKVGGSRGGDERHNSLGYSSVGSGGNGNGGGAVNYLNPNTMADETQNNVTPSQHSQQHNTQGHTPKLSLAGPITDL